jgi:hypothetical protein
VGLESGCQRTASIGAIGVDPLHRDSPVAVFFMYAAGTRSVMSACT